jgi:hypothetical protein
MMKSTAPMAVMKNTRFATSWGPDSDFAAMVYLLVDWNARSRRASPGPRNKECATSAFRAEFERINRRRAEPQQTQDLRTVGEMCISCATHTHSLRSHDFDSPGRSRPRRFAPRAVAEPRDRVRAREGDRNTLARRSCSMW